MNDILIKMLENEKCQLLFKLKLVDEAIEAYKTPGIIPDQQLNGFNISDTSTPENLYNQNMQGVLKKYQLYNKAAPTRNKILFIIKTENRFLHVREIARTMQQLEGEVLLSGVIKKVSPALSILKRIPGSPLVSIEVAHSHFNTFWGYNSWLNEDGSIKDGFKYNEAEITKFQRENFFNIAV